MNLFGSYTSDGKRVLFYLGERSSTSITGPFPLLLPPFTTTFLNGDISTLHHVIPKSKKTTQDKTMTLCVLQEHICTHKAKCITTNPSKITQQFHQKIKYPYSRIKYTDINRNTRSKRYMTRNVKYIEKEAKPIPFVEDW